MSGPTGKQLADFLSEASEIVEAVSRDLLRLEAKGVEDPDPDLINTLFREAHSLKGLAAMFGVSKMAQLGHTLEDLLDGLRLARVPATPQVLDILLEAVELFTRMLTELEAGAEAGSSPALAASVDTLSARIAELAASTGAAPEDDPLGFLALPKGMLSVLTEYEEHRLRENAKKRRRIFVVRATFDLATFDKELADLNAQLKLAGEVVSTLPSAEPDATGIGFDLLFASEHGPAEITTALGSIVARVEEVGGRELPNAPPPRKRAAAAAASTPEEPVAEDREGEEPAVSLRSVTQTVRVDIRKLDRLMNLVGELVLAKTNLQRLTEAVRATSADKHLAAELQREGKTLERKLGELQDGIIEVRMVPLGQIFDKLARMVRKIARDSSKEIDLEVRGGDVELDKLIVEDLSDPLMHLIRNSIDHGIEQPDVRNAEGKPRRGLLVLTASQRGNHVVLEVTDDGSGIDVERVKEVAIERGVLAKDASAELSRRDLLNLIFQPGFSTARFVSELSGRGVGLDVVKTNIAKLSGLIDVQTELGVGTTFRITLPVTLAIIRALVVGVHGRIFAVPLNSVLETLAISPSDIRTIERREVIDLRGSTLRLVRLGELFRLDPVDPTPARTYVVVVGLAQERVGIAVDELTGQQDVIIKPLGRQLGQVRGIAGATDLGNRRTVLVLDVGGIIEEVLTGERLAEAG